MRRLILISLHKDFLTASEVDVGWGEDAGQLVRDAALLYCASSNPASWHHPVIVVATELVIGFFARNGDGGDGAVAGVVEIWLA